MTIREVIDAARAEALFTSRYATGTQLESAEVAEAVAGAVRRHGGVRGCVSEMAYAYGEAPEAAAARMRWARGVVLRCYRLEKQPAARPI
jgi:hypothetical protein